MKQTQWEAGSPFAVLMKAANIDAPNKYPPTLPGVFHMRTKPYYKLAAGVTSC
ncbi:hypothetical protein CLOSTMETH_00046 [[Clostridium] methylpentosum DSM 5476]|uniref:Uncharacterized protein n=1 Tax=[Clostridium] methylpentosum DSM 5476 TaxID=537013 RepID=C0E874_9FIRM|nr:hypothetical protein CLOSTMETH_00046 [[Clostridium] methylpentosum DSM 5476]